MDSMTFRSCALIMQDQYGLFLQAKKDERIAILAVLILLVQVFLELLFAYWHYIICKFENQYTDKWEIEKKNILFFWNKKCECILKPMRFSRLVKCGRIHIENTNERLSR